MKSFIVKSALPLGGRVRLMGTLSHDKFGLVSEVLSLNSKSKDSVSPAMAQIKVSVKASQILSEDIRAIKGVSFAHKSVGVAGTTAVGTVTAVPQGELDFAVNDNVLVIGSGTWTDHAIVARSAVSKISNLPAEDAATLPSFLTAWALLHNFTTLSAGDIIIQSSGESATGNAISQLGAALGYKVLSPTSAELADTKFVSSLKDQKQNIKLAVSDRTGRISTDLARTLADGGALAVYNGVTESIAATEGVDQPAAGSIYKNVAVYGFDLTAWYASARADGSFQKALSSVLALGGEKKLNLKPKVYPQADFQKAIAEVDNRASAAVLKF